MFFNENSLSLQRFFKRRCKFSYKFRDMQEKKEKNLIRDFHQGLPFGLKGRLVVEIAALVGYTTTAVENRIKADRWSPVEREGIMRLLDSPKGREYV